MKKVKHVFATALAVLMVFCFMPLSANASISYWNPHFDSDSGILSWDTVEEANWYIWNINERTYYKVMNGDDEQISVNVYQEVDNLITEGVSLDKPITIQLRAYQRDPEDPDDWYGIPMDSYWFTETIDYDPPEIPQMNVEVGKDAIASWDAVEDASYYSYQVGNERFMSGSSTNETNVDLKEKMIEEIKDGDIKISNTSWKYRIEAHNEDGKLVGYCNGTFTFNLKPVVTIAKTSYVYDGKVKSPAVTVKVNGTTLKKGTDYKVTYATGRKNVGTYKVTVSMIGSYQGISGASKPFTIKPKATTISKLTGKSKSVVVKWKKQTVQTNGYQILLATNSKFTVNKKTVNVTKSSTASKTIKSLKASKKYFVKIRTYKTVNGSKIYSAWSSASTVKTLK